MRPTYAPLRHYLASQPGDQVVLTLPEIERIISRPLPAYARKSGFWGNNPWTNGPAWAWREAGWHVLRRTYQPPTWAITFVRDGAG